MYLLADSQLLFWKDADQVFLQRVREHLDSDSPRAAYIGASNGDAREFYNIFEAAMAGIGVTHCRMITSSFDAEDQSFLDSADIVLLAGGDVEAGWKIFTESKMKQSIEQRYAAGAVLIGVSAGAMQLGLYGIVELEQTSHRLVDTFKFVPFVIAVHEERRDWESLNSIISMLEGAASGIGISSGAGIIYHPDGSLEAIRTPASMFSIVGAEMKRSLILPGASAGETPGTDEDTAQT